MNNSNNLNVIAAVILSLGIIFAWQHFFERPKIANVVEKNNKIVKKTPLENNVEEFSDINTVLSSGNRVSFKNDMVKGSINLKGLRFDDLVLLKHTEDRDWSEPVRLLSPSNTKEGYFASFGWQSSNTMVDFPDDNTLWSANKDEISVGEKIEFTWTNSLNVKFMATVWLDNAYMFHIHTNVINNSSQVIQWKQYAFLNLYHEEKEHKNENNVYQGMIGALDGELQERSYSDMREKPRQHFSNKQVEWLGITSKYWLTSFIPDRGAKYNVNISYIRDSSIPRYQADFIGSKQTLAPKENLKTEMMMFVGAKNTFILDQYSKEYNILLFDRSVDFGWLHFITKPIFYVMVWVHNICGNYGLSILLVTVLIRILMFPLSNYSFKAMGKLKLLQPKIETLKELYGDDQAKLNQEIMSLYKSEKANPFSGCLPLLIQIPIFFAIYKVLSVAIELRHAPFYFWIHDLSAVDSSNIFTLLGLIEWNPPAFLHIGLWPIFMAVSMFLQQKMSPAPTDPIQAKVMKFLPLMFLVMFAKFPAGLLIYWTWSNILSIGQQFLVNKISGAENK